MLDRRIWGVLFTAVLAGVLPSACGGEEVTKVVESPTHAGVEGDTCAQPTDCEEGLRCINAKCVASESDALGGAGESCQSKDHCLPNLSCINNVCTDPSASDGGVQEGSGRRGETCQTRADCEAGLTCVNSTCVNDDFGLDPTATTCQQVACLTADDCLTSEATCESYHTGLSGCDDDPTSYTCDYLEIYCTAANWTCSAAGACSYSGDCGTIYGYCPGILTCDLDSNTCLECTTSDECSLTEECIDNVCVPSCEEDRDCPPLWECQDNQCVETGCTTNRECVALTGNALSQCMSGECAEPCQTDVECANPNNYNFTACIDGLCQAVGCETDDECRLYWGSGFWVCQ